MSRFSIPNFKFIVAALCIGIIAAQLGSCSQPAEAIKLSGPTMGTRYNITLYPPEDVELDAKVIQQEIDASLVRINQQMLTYIKDSEISRFNDSQSTDWFPISPEFLKVTAAAQAISAMSKGAFDITVGPLVDLWGFGPNFKNNNPDDEAIEAARALMGYQRLELQQSPPALRKQIAGLRIDLSAIAKGYAVDALAEQLEAKGITSYLVEVGGEIRAHGRKVNGDLWRIAIEKPSTTERIIQEGILLDNVGVATSGDYRNYFERDGERYSHTIDPATGKPIKHRLASVTVLHESSMMADGLATALMVLGEKQGETFLKDNNLSGYMISRAANGNGFESWNNFSEALFIKP